MRATRWLVALLSLLLVAVLTWWDLSRTQVGPGALHPAHAAVESLRHGGNCTACHRDGHVSGTACMECHAAIRGQAQSRQGLHGSLAVAALRQCQQCHPEHHGGQVPLLPPHAFARAGATEASYDHRHVAFELDGVHAQLRCVQCHESANSQSPPLGGRYLGLSQACTQCHRDAHGGALGESCAACHGQDQPWPNAPGFRHQSFPLRDAHRDIACVGCHAPASERSLAKVHGQSLEPRACAGCHENPHAAGGDARPSLRFENAQDCARCHDASRWQSARVTAPQHEALGFPLRGPHAQAACATCHGDDRREPVWWASHPGQAPDAEQCAACHDHSHGGELMAAADGCTDCHRDVDASFAEGRISVEVHRAAGFALARPHAEVACSACHAGTRSEQRYPGRSEHDCRACHEDVHGNQFGTGRDAPQCTECHLRERFLPHRFGVARHAQTFPLTGSHDAVACTACHTTLVHGVRQFRGTPRRCAACHDDVHGGRFDAVGLPAEVAGRNGCARCHQTDTFRRLAAPFDHGLWTSYELQGAHAGVACASCHPGSSASRPGTVPGRTCASCHEDPHLGQFRDEQGAVACARCHDPIAWGETRFDHQKHSRFALDRVHSRLECAECHKAYSVGARQVVRYRPLGVACADCHRLGKAHGRTR